MTSIRITEDIKQKLSAFLKKNRKIDLLGIYFYFIEIEFHIQPVLFPKEKMIYQSLENLIGHLEKDKKLWRETEIRIQIGQESVNEETKRIYICPFTGKVFGDNTHPNPQDAIYDWVSRCPENVPSPGELKVKRFFVSEDPEVIKNYMGKKKTTISKIVYSSVVTGKLFNSRQSVIDDFKKNHIKSLTLFEVQNQNRYQIEIHFMNFLQELLTEEKISSFVEALSEHREFEPYLKNWLEEEEQA